MMYTEEKKKQAITRVNGTIAKTMAAIKLADFREPTADEVTSAIESLMTEPIQQEHPDRMVYGDKK